MKAPCEEEGGIIAQDSPDVNRLFASKTNMQLQTYDLANFPPSSEASLSGRNSSHYFLYELRTRM
jgi:hypothetical protein